MFRGPYTVRQAGYAQSARYTALFLKKLMIMMMMVMRGIIHSFIRRIAIRHCNGARSKPTTTHSLTQSPHRARKSAGNELGGTCPNMQLVITLDQPRAHAYSIHHGASPTESHTGRVLCDLLRARAHACPTAPFPCFDGRGYPN